MRQPWKVMGGYWYPPSAQQEKALQDAAEAAARPHVPPGAAPREGWQFPNQRNVRRNGMRKKAAETARHARWADAAEGEVSSDGQSSTMSKVARKVGGMGWGSSAAHGYEIEVQTTCARAAGAAADTPGGGNATRGPGTRG